VDLISLIIGFVVGIVAVSIAIELGWKKEAPVQTCKIARQWHLSEISRPIVVAEKLKMQPPQNAQVVVQTHTAYSKDAKQHSDVTGNFVLGSDRALIFAGEIREGQMAFRTVDDAILRHLRSRFHHYWEDSGQRAEETGVRGTGRVTARGIVKAVVPYRDQFLLRLSTSEGVIGVLVNERLDLEGHKIEVDGEMVGVDRPFVKSYHIDVLT
jgi:hypothetical protein